VGAMPNNKEITKIEAEVCYGSLPFTSLHFTLDFSSHFTSLHLTDFFFPMRPNRTKQYQLITD